MRGLAYAYRHDKSIRLEVCFGVPAFGVVAYLLAPLSGTEVMFLAVAAGFIFITELLNTSIEALLDKLHPEQHEMIRISKDIASAAVLAAFAAAGVIVAALFLADAGSIPF